MSVYTISFSNISIAAQQDFFSFQPAANKPVVIHEVRISNVAIAAQSGDAHEEMLGIEICRGNTTIGSGGTNPTAQPIRTSAAAFGPTTNVRANDTTKVTGGTRTLLVADGFNSRTGWLYQPVPEDRIVSMNGDNFVAVQLVTTPSATIAMSGTLVVEEL